MAAGPQFFFSTDTQIVLGNPIRRSTERTLEPDFGALWTQPGVFSADGADRGFRREPESRKAGLRRPFAATIRAGRIRPASAP